MERVLVTGATGFVGKPLCAALTANGFEVIASARRRDTDVVCNHFIALDLEAETFQDAQLQGIDSVIYVAGIAHAGRHVDIAARRYQQLNCDAAVKLARAAMRCGVRHFHYVSSVKAMGYETCAHELAETDGLPPRDPYGQSKRCAEQQLQALAGTGPMKVTVSRPALVYGAAAKGNLARLARFAQLRWMPGLPRAGSRSMLALPDLIAALLCFAAGLGRNGEIYILAGDAFCAADLVTLLRKQRGAGPPRFAIPLSLLRVLGIAGDLLHRCRLPAPWDSEQYARLFGDLRFDAGKARRELGWVARDRFGDVASVQDQGAA